MYIVKWCYNITNFLDILFKYIVNKNLYIYFKNKITKTVFYKLKFFCSNMGMTVNNDKTRIMIIKYKKDTYENSIYDNKNLEQLSSYKYLRTDIHHKLN